MFEDGYNGCDPATAARFVDWAERNGIQIQYIQPDKPNQNAFIEQFDRFYRDEVRNACSKRSIKYARAPQWWLIDYNEGRPTTPSISCRRPPTHSRPCIKKLLLSSVLVAGKLTG